MSARIMVYRGKNIMRVLGINDSHNAAASLIEDGEIVYAVQEERLNRIKNWCGFPKDSILFMLSEMNLCPKDIDFVAFAGESLPFGLDSRTYLQGIKEGENFSSTLKKYVKRTFVKKLYDGYRDRRERVNRANLMVALGFDKDKITFVDHHTCHAAAAYYGWGIFDEPVLVLSNDGFGDDLCATVNIGKDAILTRLAQVPGTDSIATIYAFITAFMGMIPLEHEYKIMGMAPYASKTKAEEVSTIFEKLMAFDEEEPFIWRRAKHCPEINHAMDYLKEMVDYIRFDHLCGGLQMFVEKMLIKWVSNCIQKTGIKKVALGGGTFMNVKANKLIAELPEVEKLFVFPSCGDESNAFGAAYYQYVRQKMHIQGKLDVQPFGNIYLGSEFSDQYIQKMLNDAARDGRIEFKKEEDINLKTAQLLIKNNIVARFTGREEFGARALGNRSILADPANSHVIKIINEMIKSRDFWMPFAPATRVENASKYVRNPKGIISPYMMMTYDTNGNREEFIAGIHPYDFTSRMQMVSEDQNRSFYDLLGKFEGITGRGVLLNTSFNLHGFPIVHTPEDALYVLLNSGLKYLTLGDFLVSKRGKEWC